MPRGDHQANSGNMQYYLVELQLYRVDIHISSLKNEEWFEAWIELCHSPLAQ
jgi:hypothetical protein